MSDGYRFDHAFEVGHFVRDYIDYASQLTDAPYEYHEAVALGLLALATPDIRMKFGPYPDGLRTNLYVVLQGDTSSSRKSTAMNIGVSLVRRFAPTATLPQKMTPEAFAQELGNRSKMPTLWAVDEFAKMLVQLHKRDFMAGLSGLLLELYNGVDQFTYSRTKNPITITFPHLNVIGCAADSIFDALHKLDIEDGLLPRFAIVMPESKPERMPFHMTADANEQAANDLVRRLAGLLPDRDETGQWRGNSRAIRFETIALQLTDDQIVQAVEREHDSIFQRLPPMALKVAMLAAVGRPRTDLSLDSPFTVEERDAEAAIKVVGRWKSGAERFMRRIGENETEKLIRRAQDCLRQAGKPMLRRDVMRKLRVDSRVMKNLEATMHERELILPCLTDGDSGKQVWRLLV